MKSMPSFLQLRCQSAASKSPESGNPMGNYQSLLGVWLLDIAIFSNWVQEPPCGSLVETFTDEKFLKVTGIKGMHKLFPGVAYGDDELELLTKEIQELEALDEVGLPKRIGKKKARKQAPPLQQALRKLLLRRRAKLLAQPCGAHLPLFQNVERLGRLLHLNQAECAVLTFAACISCFATFRYAILSNSTQIDDGDFARLLAVLTGHCEPDIRKALHGRSILVTAGLVKLEPGEQELEDKIVLARSLRAVMLDALSSEEELCARVLKLAVPGKLALRDFPHLSKDVRLLLDYLRGVMRTRAQGANVLLYGPSGCGKTEMVKALAAELGFALYEIAYADEDGDAIDGEQRLHNFNFCQQALKGKENVLLLFDEMEDVLADDTFSLFEFTQRRSSARGGKAWINRTLETNPIPTLWITNDTDIDEAYLRRFDYSLALRIPPRQVRAGIAAAYLKDYLPHGDALDALADLDDLLPAQLEHAARVAHVSAQNNPALAWEYVEMALLRSRELLGQRRVSLKSASPTAYSLDFLTTDADIPGILSGLRRQQHASLCLYGPPGSGKSLLARHVADQLGLPLLSKRASDLMDKYVGGTEQRIAAMFGQAQDEGAVLLLDEADSFLCDRMGAHEHWQVTQTNEFLTHLEHFEGIFFATTNWMDKLDAAVLRRFSHKIRFQYLSAQQRWRLFVQELARLNIHTCPGDDARLRQAIEKLDALTPGDFAAALKNLRVSSAQASADQFLQLLVAESRIKRHGRESMGFV